VPFAECVWNDLGAWSLFEEESLDQILGANHAPVPQWASQRVVVRDPGAWRTVQTTGTADPNSWLESGTSG